MKLFLWCKKPFPTTGSEGGRNSVFPLTGKSDMQKTQEMSQLSRTALNKQTNKKPRPVKYFCGSGIRTHH